MSKRRSVNASQWRIMHGRKAGECTWCGGKVKPPRRTWCCDDCVHEFRLCTDPATQRHAVEQRDRERCANCGCDTRALRAELKHANKRITLWTMHRRKTPEERRVLDAPERPEALQLARRVLEVMPPFRAKRDAPPDNMTDDELIWWAERTTRWLPSMWQADHVLPVAEGGGLTGLENLQTLCTPCHNLKTARQAARRAKGGQDADR